MTLLHDRAEARNSFVESVTGIAGTPFVVTTPARDRAWWREEAIRVGTDWQTLAEATAVALAFAGILQPDSMPHWDAPSWLQTAQEYHEQRAGRAGTETIEPKRLACLCQLMKPGVTLDLAWHEINDKRPTPEVTVEAIKQAVRERGLAALNEPAVRARVQRCDDAAIANVNEWLADLKKKTRP